MPNWTNENGVSDFHGGDDAPFIIGSDTSQGAAAAIAPDLNDLQQRVLDVIRRGGATDDEIQVALDMNPSTERPRRIELVNQGLVCASGGRRPTRAGLPAVVWQAHMGPICPCIASDEVIGAAMSAGPAALPMIEGGFSCIVADPPWTYDNTASRGAAENHYQTMSVHEICAMPVAQIAAKSAHLYLWVTDAVLEDVFRLDLFSAWGFKFKQHLSWFKTKNGKPQMGMGNYYRHSTELLLFGTRGKAPVKRHDALDFLAAPREEHSKKPDLFQYMIQDMSAGPYLELFARRELAGWVTWGNQIT